MKIKISMGEKGYFPCVIPNLPITLGKPEKNIFSQIPIFLHFFLYILKKIKYSTIVVRVRGIVLLNGDSGEMKMEKEFRFKFKKTKVRVFTAQTLKGPQSWAFVEVQVVGRRHGSVLKATVSPSGETDTHGIGWDLPTLIKHMGIDPFSPEGWSLREEWPRFARSAGLAVLKKGVGKWGK